MDRAHESERCVDVIADAGENEIGPEGVEVDLGTVHRCSDTDGITGRLDDARK